MGQHVRIASLVVAFLLFPSRSFGQLGGSNSVRLTGTVFSSQGNRPIEQVRIELCDAGSNMIQQTMTNGSGEFGFRGITRGTYILILSAVGYRTQNVHVDLSLTSERGISIYLDPEPKEATETSHSSTVSAHEMSMPEKARDLMMSGQKKLYQNKDAKGALGDFQQAVSIAPGYYEAYYQIAMADIDLGQGETAEKNLHKAVELSNDKYGEADIGLGTLMLNAGNATGAEKTLRRGLELNPNFWLGHYELGRALLEENRLNDAQKYGEQARSLAPGSPIVYRLLAKIHLKRNDYPALLQDLDAYIRLDPDSPAGKRAQEMRAQIAQKVGPQAAPAVAASKPN